jgi:hypothetical protein
MYSLDKFNPRMILHDYWARQRNREEAHYNDAETFNNFSPQVKGLP